jgi:hypothetical protein
MVRVRSDTYELMWVTKYSTHIHVTSVFVNSWAMMCIGKDYENFAQLGGSWRRLKIAEIMMTISSVKYYPRESSCRSSVMIHTTMKLLRVNGAPQHQLSVYCRSRLAKRTTAKKRARKEKLSNSGLAFAWMTLSVVASCPQTAILINTRNFFTEVFVTVPPYLQFKWNWHVKLMSLWNYIIKY